MKVSLPHDKAGRVDLVANPINFSKTRITYQLPPPMLGQHSVEILNSWLGLDDQAIDNLIEQGVVIQL